MSNNRRTWQSFEEMHKAGLLKLDQVDWAILEPDGRIAIVPVRRPGDPIGQTVHTEQETVVGG